MPQPSSIHKASPSVAQAISEKDYLALAGFLEGRERIQRVHKKEPIGEAVRKAGEMYANREFVSAYECFQPVYAKVVSNMKGVIARPLDLEASKLAKEQRKPLAVAKEHVQSIKAHAQQVIDQFDRLLQDLERKPLVRIHLKKGRSASAAHTPSVEDATPTTLNSANETQLEASTSAKLDIANGDIRYKKTPYSPPQIGALYSVRDKSKGDCVIRVIGKSPDSTLVQVEILKDGKPSNQPIQLAVDSLVRQAQQGWCSLLLPVTENGEAPPVAANRPAAANPSNATMRLDIQNFGRCCADIQRANIRFDTQLIKDVGDGPFRAGNYDQAFLTFEQYAVGFGSAVASSRRAIADGRRALTAEKGKLSGKEIQERTAAFIRSEQLIHTAEREFSTILEGLRMYLRARQG